MKKIFLITVTLCLIIVSQFASTQAVHAQSLEEQRESLIESYRTGISQSFSYEEVDAYLISEETYVLETGTIRNYSSYGINGNHSTAHALEMVEYLVTYLNANTTESDLEELYPYQVDFDELPEFLTFYPLEKGIYSDFELVNEGGQLKILENTTNVDRTYLLDKRPFTGYLNNTGTKEIQVLAGGSVRMVGVNTQVIIQEISAHRTDYAFYFFYNKENKLSLAMWEAENPRDTLVEYSTKKTIDELKGNSAASVSPSSTSEWTLPHDWRMLSPRRGDVPPVTWVLLSHGDEQTIAIEPVFHDDGIVSGFINPNYSVEIYTQNVNTKEISANYSAQPDASGYFSTKTDATVATPPTIRIVDEVGQLVFEKGLGVQEYRPTALEHDSGYLTLERYFVDQNYMEGYTYPNATVEIFTLSGYASTGGNTTKSDSNGYFYIQTPPHSSNLTTNIVSVIHPETGENISVAPYPWTTWELENAVW